MEDQRYASDDRRYQQNIFKLTRSHLRITQLGLNMV